MLNDKQERELCYVVSVEEIRPLDGYDRVEYARIGAGWWIVVRKGQFKVGDLAIYFEIDSKVPEKEPFMFLESKKFKIKTQRLCKCLSQGLLMSAEDFGWKLVKFEEKDVEYATVSVMQYIQDNEGNNYSLGNFLTKRLGVTYYSPEDEQNKAPSSDKYQKMMQRHRKLFKNKFILWLYNKNFGKKILFKLFGRKKDKKTDWPVWVVKTDEERCQNLSYLFPGNDEEWVATEKIDGTSTTFTMRNDKKREFLVCSRNVVYDTPAKENKNFYKDTCGNVYIEMAEKYRIREMLCNVLDKNPALEFITIQGETFGGNIQKRNYGDEHRFAAFNVIYKRPGKERVRLNPIQMTEFLTRYQVCNAPTLPPVPIVNLHFKIPATCEELLQIAAGASQIDGGMREGLVFRSKDGERSFKAVSNEFLLKYHSN